MKLPGKKIFSNLSKTDFCTVVCSSAEFLLKNTNVDSAEDIVMPGRFIADAELWQFLKEVFDARVKTNTIEIKGTMMPGSLVYPTFEDLKKELVWNGDSKTEMG